jgi:hypothetical protein
MGGGVVSRNGWKTKSLVIFTGDSGVMVDSTIDDRSKPLVSLHLVSTVNRTTNKRGMSKNRKSDGPLEVTPRHQGAKQHLSW